MKTNFKIVETIYLDNDNSLIDLHNNFDFKEIIENPKSSTIELKWEINKGDWVKEDEYSEVILTLNKISFKYFEDGKQDFSKEDSDTLSFLTYFPSRLRDVNDCFVNQEYPKDGDDILFSFQDGSLFRFHCDSIHLGVIK